MKFPQLFFVVLMAGCMSLQMNAKLGGDVGPSVDATMRVGGDRMPFDHFLNEASKKIKNLKGYIKQQQNQLAKSKYASLEGRRDAIKAIEARIKEKIEAIKFELSSAQDSGYFWG